MCPAAPVSVIASQSADWRGNPFLLFRHGVTDSHTSDIGHWFGMTVMRRGVVTPPYSNQQQPSADAACGVFRRKIRIYPPFSGWFFPENPLQSHYKYGNILHGSMC